MQFKRFLQKFSAHFAAIQWRCNASNNVWINFCVKIFFPPPQCKSVLPNLRHKFNQTKNQGPINPELKKSDRERPIISVKSTQIKTLKRSLLQSISNQNNWERDWCDVLFYQCRAEQPQINIKSRLVQFTKKGNSWNLKGKTLLAKKTNISVLFLWSMCKCLFFYCFVLFRRLLEATSYRGPHIIYLSYG